MARRMPSPEAAGAKLLTEAAERMKLSARGYHRVLKVVRTIADLAGTDSVSKSHIAEALPPPPEDELAGFASATAS